MIEEGLSSRQLIDQQVRRRDCEAPPQQKPLQSLGHRRKPISEVGAPRGANHRKVAAVGMIG